jgi:hypothetical protein
MRLTDLLPQLDDTVWIGMSAGSMVTAPHHSASTTDVPAGRGDAT